MDIHNYCIGVHVGCAIKKVNSQVLAGLVNTTKQFLFETQYSLAYTQSLILQLNTETTNIIHIRFIHFILFILYDQLVILYHISLYVFHYSTIYEEKSREETVSHIHVRE